MSTRHNSKLFRRLTLLIIIGMLIGLVVLPGASASSKSALSPQQLNHLSQSVALRYWMANPDQAPSDLQGRFQSIKEITNKTPRFNSPSKPSALTHHNGDAFNNDHIGLLQNEESVSACLSNMDIVLG